MKRKKEDKGFDDENVEAHYKHYESYIEEGIEEGNKKTGRKFDYYQKLAIFLVFVLAVSAIIGFFYIPKDEKISVSLIEIKGTEDLFDLSQVKAFIAQDSSLDIKNEKTLDSNSKEAQSLISKYKIDRLPVLLITSKKIDKVNVDKTMFSSSGNALIFDSGVPYFSLTENKVKGEVSIKEIYDLSCKECSAGTSIIEQLKKAGVKIIEENKIEVSSEQGKSLIASTGITKIPSLLASNDLNEYSWLETTLEPLTRESGEFIVFGEAGFPYKEVSTGKIRGIVEVKFLYDSSCTDCFNVTILKEAFQNLGVYIGKERYIDINSLEGKSIVNMYNITAVPTTIFSPEISVYISIQDILSGVGSYEKDNYYVFRRVDVLKQKYKTL